MHIAYTYSWFRQVPVLTDLKLGGTEWPKTIKRLWICICSGRPHVMHHTDQAPQIEHRPDTPNRQWHQRTRCSMDKRSWPRDVSSLWTLLGWVQEMDQWRGTSTPNLLTWPDQQNGSLVFFYPFWWWLALPLSCVDKVAWPSEGLCLPNNLIQQRHVCPWIFKAYIPQVSQNKLTTPLSWTLWSSRQEDAQGYVHVAKVMMD